MLGINLESDEFKNFESMYKDVLKNHVPQSKEEMNTLKQIRVDVQRTFRTFNLKYLSAKIDSGENKLYNILTVYALFLDP